MQKDRLVVLDTETTGLDPETNRVIEIGAVEVINRKITGKTYHEYINPEQEVPPESSAIHGLTNEFLQNKPLFAEVASSFLDFIKGSTVVIHNAQFDVSFLNKELSLLPEKCTISQVAYSVFDTLDLAKKKHPGKHNNLDALCKRYKIDNTNRMLHGALLDAQLLALVYLAMTGGQMSLFDDENDLRSVSEKTSALDKEVLTKVIYANAEELLAHQKIMAKLLAAKSK